jgi:hypothetical protein
MAQTALQEHGKEFLAECSPFRHYFELANCVYTIENIDNIIAQLEVHIGIKLTDYDCKVVERESATGFHMLWHLDDVAPIKTSRNLDSIENGIVIGNKFRLYHKDKLPTFSAIIYLSKYGEDFTGGEFEFLDQQIIPKKNWILFFSSKDVHRVLTVKSGIRKNILIKFY